MNKVIRISVFAAAFAVFAILPASVAHAGVYSGFYDDTEYEIPLEYDWTYQDPGYEIPLEVSYDEYDAGYEIPLDISYDEYDTGYEIPLDDCLLSSYDEEDEIVIDTDIPEYEDDVLEPAAPVQEKKEAKSARVGSYDPNGSTSVGSRSCDADDIARPAVKDKGKPVAPAASSASVSSNGSKGASGTVTSEMSTALGTINAKRAKAGAGSLSFSEELNLAAAQRAKEATQRFSHIRPNGKNAVTVLSENGIEYNVSGENITLGYSSAASAVDAWSLSPSHNRCMLNVDYAKAGLGCATVGGYTVWVLILTD
ncbi:MAG: hypothetical protein K6F34_03950 [Lachnospiraceae bacterium]|nr:hypothetical protein [Lachnospiraceae bacterium]